MSVRNKLEIKRIRNAFNVRRKKLQNKLARSVWGYNAKTKKYKLLGFGRE